ncbi:MAG: sodium-dependent transporter [Pseudomonadota bacterium]
MAQVKAASGDHWSSRIAFLFAAVGSSVGLGNFWRFPYEAGANGGSAFVLLYVVAVLLLGAPILMAELFVGRRGGGSAIGSIARVAKESGASPIVASFWTLAGWCGIVASFCVLSFYGVIAGWIIAYIVTFLTGALKGASPETVAALFEALLANPGRMAFFQALFMGMTVLIIARGLKGGIETAVDILMPTFFIMLIGITIAVCWIGDAGAAAEFLLTPDFSKITPDVVAAAVGQAFFSIGLGSAIMYAYGAYMTKDLNIPRSGAIIIASDTFVAMIAGFAIFPLVFAFGLDPAGGPGLLFVTLPIAFAQMPFGMVLGAVFFFLALFAALTSAISLLEAMTALGAEHGHNNRPAISIGTGLVCYILGIGSVLSFNVLKDFHPLGFLPLFEGQGVLDMLDTLTSRILMPLSGFITALFAGWAVTREAAKDELSFLSPWGFQVWRFLVRFIAPTALFIVILHGLTN